MNMNINIPEQLKTEALQIKELLQEMNKPKNITHIVKSFEDVCIILNINLDYSHYNSKISIATEKLELIYKVLNQGWKPNWSNSNEYKYFPYFKMSPFGFDDAGCGIWVTVSDAGSRLCGKTDTIAEYTGRQFEDLYRDFMEISPTI